MKAEQDWPLHDSSSHITNIGRMIEEMEIKMRNLLQEVRKPLPCSMILYFRFVGVLWENARRGVRPSKC